MKRIAIIVLNWQGWQDTIACLESLRLLVSPYPLTIIVCDNASHDESFSQISQWAQQYYTPTELAIFTEPPVLSQQSDTIPTFVLIQTGENLGFAGGNNVGIRYALTQEHDYIWLLNNDTVVDEQALSALCHYADHHTQTALIGSTVLDYFQPDTVQCAGGCRYFPLLTLFKPILGGKPLNTVLLQTENTMKLDYVYGAAMFLKVSAIRQVGLLNEEYFLFYEELDYTQRLKRQGYAIGWCKESFVYHKGSASVGSVREGNREKLKRANYYENLSTLKYTANFYPRWLPVVMVLRFVLKTLVLSKRGDFYLLSPLFRAYRDFFKR